MAPRQEWIDFGPQADPMDMLIGLSRYYGSDEEFILAGGGNTSMKAGERLYIKGSGHALATITAEGFVEMDRRAIEALLARDLGDDVDERERRFKEAVLAARVHPEKAQRPSVEVVLHHLLPGRFVVHSHPTLVNAFTCCQRGEELLRGLLGDQMLWVPFVDPGFILARTVHKALAEHAKRTGVANPLVLMQNHGLIVNGETPAEVRLKTDALMEKLCGRLERVAAGKPPFGTVKRVGPGRAAELAAAVAPVLRDSAGPGEPPRATAFDDSETVMQLVGGAEGQAVAAGGPLSPDQIVYCKSFPLWFDPPEGDPPARIAGRLRDAVARHVETTGFPPLIVLVRGLGLFGVGDSPSGADTARAVYVDAIKVMAAARRLGGIHYMTPRDRDFIEHWEVESYRRKVARGG